MECCDTEENFGDLVATAPSGTGMGAAHEIAGGQFPSGQGSVSPHSSVKLIYTECWKC